MGRYNIEIAFSDSVFYIASQSLYSRKKHYLAYIMIKTLVQKELQRQSKTINLIASENYPSTAVLDMLGARIKSDRNGAVFSLVGKYAEGTPHKRYYFGNQVVDQIEDLVIALAQKVFKLSPKNWHVNVQAHSGTPANLASYLGSLELGDKILSMSLDHGGHLSHGHFLSLTGKLFKFVHYGVGQDGFLNYDEIAKIAKKEKPKLIVCGGSAYPRQIDFKKFREIADSVGALLMVDMAHIAGLVAGGVHPSPFPHADIVTTTTHKTLRGPRGALLFVRISDEAARKRTEAIDKAIFPGLQGGPHLHTIAAIGVALEESLKPAFKNYAKQVVKNAKALADGLKKEGFEIISGGTDNHLMLIDVTRRGYSGKEAGQLLEKNGIIVNKNAIPFDLRKPWDPSGIRLGTPALTTLGYTEKDMLAIAVKIGQILR